MSEIDNNKVSYLQIALDIPVRQLFSYSCTGVRPAVGCRVRVTVGKRAMIGIVISYSDKAPRGIKLKSIEAQLDREPLFSQELIDLIDWCSRYYHQPLGEVWSAALPLVLRKGMSADHGLLERVYSFGPESDEWKQTLKRAPSQKRIMELIDSGSGEMTHREILQVFPGCQSILKALMNKGCLVQKSRMLSPDLRPPDIDPVKLSQDQERVLNSLLKTGESFSCSVLEGITGSGKTEVYFALIDRCLAAGKQALVLLPEIALTDQLMNRFVSRFGTRVVQVHSGMGDSLRYRRWWEIHSGMVDVVLATRSGVFQSFSNLGLILIDEEHDASYKQQEGVRYHARSLALKRAQLLDIPVVIGSATPSLETCYNIELGKYQHVVLSQRAGQGMLPEVFTVDLNRYQSESGLSQPSVKALSKVFKNQRQSLVFINRRGFAPVLYCSECRWSARCYRCDAQMTLHRPGQRLQCHHCGAQRQRPVKCEDCGADALVELGEGTQKIEESLRECFPTARVQRFDRDELTTESSLRKAMQAVHSGEVDILVGTQLLSKGHDFSRVDLVLVINADQGLHSIDFRASEQLVQQLIQVAGRAGRAAAQGKVLIQTHLPHHPVFDAVVKHDYRRFVEQELCLREQAGFPPYAFIALWRLRSRRAEEPLSLLSQIADIGRSICPQNASCFDPVKSPMFKRGGQYHAQLLCSAPKRSSLHGWLAEWIRRVETEPRLARSRWSIDVDPVSLF